ncbi:MAG: glycosyltransferase family 2 protein [Propionibacteriales bacterium]|nr:glycosyltransferase family 2 protein [Propionibacteriales bacterium]
MKVTALLVCHNGGRWLPAVLAGLDGSSRLPDEVVAVDTGSSDDSVAVVERALGRAVVGLDARTSYAAAVRAGLQQAPAAQTDEWVWLLHDDATPERGALAALVEAAERAPREVAVLGPKIREWPSLKRLLEVGVTLTGTGRRETGLERGEYDQGQHDESHRVLAVNTAGMLVRRDVLESVGLDDYLPVLGTDLDFGWRVARAGYSTLVVPEAIVFHDEASRRGRRDSELVHHPGRQDREGAQYTLLVNSPAWTIPFRSARMVIGGVLRALGLLLVRAPGEAADEIVALFHVFSHPARAFRARRARAGAATVPHSEVRPLLAPFWLPYRHGLDYVTDVGVAIAHSVRDEAERRRPPGSAEVGLGLRLLRSTTFWAVVVSFVLAFVAGRDLLQGGPLQGGALLPAPDGVDHWWQVWSSGRQRLGTGTDAPGPAYLLPLAVLGTVLFGHAGLVLVLLFVLAVPLAFVGALRFLRRLTERPWAPLWGAAAYAVLPVVSGSVAQGRLGTVAGAVIVPWLATAALGLAATGPDAATRRWRAAWRAALLAGLLVSFVPPAWLVMLVVVLFAGVAGAISGRGREVAIVLVVPLLLVLPWAVVTLGSPGAWLVEAGRAGALPIDAHLVDLLLGRTSGPGEAPGWLTVGLPLAGLAAFVRADTRVRVLQVWVVILASAIVLAAESRVPVSLPGVPVEFRPWPGFLVLLMQAGYVVAAVIAADGAIKVASESSFGWRQPIAAVASIAALAAPALGAVWWVSHGDDGPLVRADLRGVPTYMQELAATSDTSAVLVVRGGLKHGIEYDLLRSGVHRLGDDGVLELTAPSRPFADLVARLLSSARADDAAALAAYGVKYVYAPAPVAASVNGGLDSANGLGGASAPGRGSRAWVVQERTSLRSLDHDRDELRPVWVVADLLALVTCLVLAAPERRRRR